MLRLPLVALLWCFAVGAETYQRIEFGSTVVTSYWSRDYLEIRRGSLVWRVDKSRLPVRRSDCEDETRRAAYCQALSARSQCTQCAGPMNILAWDDAHRRLYFAVPTGTAKNKPWIIFRYSLRTRAIERISSDYGGGFGTGEVSRSGQYLAYIGYEKMGACGTSGLLVVVDTWARRLGTVEVDTETGDEIGDIENIRWASPTTIEYDTHVHSAAACRLGAESSVRKARESLNIGDIEFTERR